MVHPSLGPGSRVGVKACDNPRLEAKETGLGSPSNGGLPRELAAQQASVRSAAEIYLESLGAHGVEYLFANAGTDFPPVVEGLARGEERGASMPRALVVPHENIAVGMAHGYYNVTGRPQAVMVHVNVGTANGINCIINAARDNVPILYSSGRTPATESGKLGSRSRFIHWAQEMFDQAGMVRESVKWEYELRYPEQAADVVARAWEQAMTHPRGPVYTALPREALAAPAQTEASRPRALPAAPHPDPAAVAQLAGWIVQAERPVLVTAGAGHDAKAVAALASLAERCAIPVTQTAPRYLCLPAGHPMHLGYWPTPLLAEADLVIVLDCDVPWIPSQESPPAGCRVVHIGVDPTFSRYPMRSFPSDLSIAADPAATLSALQAAVVPDTKRVSARRARLATARDGLRAKWASEARPGAPMSFAYVSRCIAEAKGDDAVVFNEYPLRLEQCPFDRPGTFFHNSPAGGLGWGLGAALGAKLALKDRTVIATLGDGAYIFANPTAGHWVAAAYGLPILVVVFNNSLWGAVRRATSAMYKNGVSARQDWRGLANLSPAPAYEKLIEAHGGHGERVERAEDLPQALARALAATRKGKQALLNVLCE
jgi:acetolactate synthase I/II/III large subunit